MAREEKTNEPEEDIDIEEKQEISKKKRVVIAPIVKWMLILMVIAKEREVEE